MRADRDDDVDGGGGGGGDGGGDDGNPYCILGLRLKINPSVENQVASIMMKTAMVHLLWAYISIAPT